MFGTIRRHQAWLWVIIATVTIVSFVIFGPTNTRFGRALLGGQGEFGTLLGQPITLEQYQNAMHEVALQSFSRTVQWPEEDSPMMRRETYVRLFLIRKQEDLGIKVSTDAAAALAERILTGPISKYTGPITLNDFTEKILKKQRMDAGDLDRFLRHEAGLEQLMLSAGVGGTLIAPEAAEALYRIEHREMSVELVSFPVSNFVDAVPVTTEALAAFYTNDLARYREPEKLQVNFVKFDLTNYLAGAQAMFTNLNELVEENYRQNGTNAIPGANTPEEGKAKIREAILREQALRLARKDAADFAQKLYNAVQTNKAVRLETFAGTNLTVQTTPPFSQQDLGPPGMNVGPDFTRSAYGLSPTEPFSGALRGEDGVYVLGFDRRIPSATPSLKDIEARVTTDYRNRTALELAQQTAAKFAVSLNNGLLMGKSFSNLCEEAKVKPETVPPFSLSSNPMPGDLEQRFEPNEFKTNAFATPVGKASPVINTREGSYLVLMLRQTPPDETRVKMEAPALLSDLRRARQSEVFNKWILQELRQDQAFFQMIDKLSREAQTRAAASREQP